MHERCVFYYHCYSVNAHITLTHIYIETLPNYVKVDQICSGIFAIGIILNNQSRCEPVEMLNIVARCGACSTNTCNIHEKKDYAYFQVFHSTEIDGWVRPAPDHPNIMLPSFGIRQILLPLKSLYLRSRIARHSLQIAYV